MNDPNTVTPAEYARMRGVSRARVTQMVQEGRAVADDSGNILVAETDERWTRRIKAEIDSQAESTSYTEARTRKELAEAHLRELKLAIELGQVIEVGLVRRTWYGLLRSLRDALLGIPDRVCHALADMDDPHAIREHLAAEIRQALGGLPRSPPVAPAESDMDEGPGGPETPAGGDGLSMG